MAGALYLLGAVMEAKELDQVVAGYVEAMLWAEHDDQGEPFDRRYEADDVADESLEVIRRDIKTFVEGAETLGLLHVAGRMFWVGDQTDTANYLPYLGHDIHLTRNGHGAGFWDRGYGAEGDELTRLAKELRPAYPWAEGGRVYVERG